VATRDDLEALIQEEAPEAANSEGPHVRVVIPDPTLCVGRRGEDEALRTQDSLGFRDGCPGVLDVLEQILHDNGVETAVAERERLVDITEDDVAPEFDCLRHRVGRAIDAGVVGKMPREPSRPAADVE
jgi:hypothetical protein